MNVETTFCASWVISQLLNVDFMLIMNFPVYYNEVNAVAMMLSSDQPPESLKNQRRSNETQKY